MTEPLHYHHVDVFAAQPYSGNSLAVFPDAAGLDTAQMVRITRELRHFESIFLFPTADAHRVRARVFDLIEELDFAGHPVIGAACLLHALHGRAEQYGDWTIELNARTVRVRTQRYADTRYGAVLDQGAAEFLSTPDRSRRAELASWFGLDEHDLDPGLDPQVVSTGLRYLVMPVRGDALARARILSSIEDGLAAVGAQFAYLLDTTVLEGRHWNNDGVVEDVATGSAAGCAAAYLRRHGRIGDGSTALLRQGRFTGRPSEMTIRAYGDGTAVRSVEVGGDVVLIGAGRLDMLPTGSTLP